MGEIVTGKYGSGRKFRHRLLTETKEFTRYQIQVANALLDSHRYSVVLDRQRRRQILKDWLQNNVDLGVKKSEAKNNISNALKAGKEGFVKHINDTIRRNARRGRDVYRTTMDIYGVDVKRMTDDIRWVESL